LNDKIERIMKKIIEEKEVEMQKITGTKKKRSPPSMFI
jgi:hypothetical protein